MSEKKERPNLADTLGLAAWIGRWPKITIAIASILVYVRSFKVPFHFDDSHSIENNPGVKSLRHLFSYWSDPVWTSILPANRVFRPVTFMAYDVAWWAGGGRVEAFHALKIALHTGLSIAVFFVWKELMLWPIFGGNHTSIDQNSEQTQIARSTALIAALGFALHPALSESNIYISSMSSTLCAFFYALSLAFFLRHRNHKTRRNLVLSLALYALSVFSKEEGITLPAIIFMLSMINPSTSGGAPLNPLQKITRSLRASSPYIAVGIILAIIVALKIPKSMEESRGNVSASLYFATQLGAWLHYLKLLVWPTGLNPDNVGFGFATSWSDPQVIESIAGLATLALVSWTWRMTQPLIAWTLFTAWITLLPTSSLIPLAEPVNERRMILAFFFLIPSSTLLLKRLDLLKPALLLPLLVSFTLMIQNRIDVWSSPFSLWQDVIKKNPENGRAMNNLALQHMAIAQYKEADELLKNCIRVWPQYYTCHINRGIVSDRLGDPAGAEKSFREAIQLNTGNLNAHFYYGVFLERQNRIKEAFNEYKTANDVTGGVYVEAIQRILSLADRFPTEFRGPDLDTLRVRLNELNRR